MNREREATAGKHRQAWWQAGAVVTMGVIYVVALWWIDRENGAFGRLLDQGAILIATLPFVFATYAIRYARWAWLLRRRGHDVPFFSGFLAYLAGFALTATPGKAGELLRIRYFERLDVPPARTMAVFVFERACDLLVILALSLLAAKVFPTIGMLCLVVLLFTGTLFGIAAWPTAVGAIGESGQRLPGRPLKRIVAFAIAALSELGVHLEVRALVVGLSSGLLAWGVTSLVFVGFCEALGIEVPLIALMGVYPLAMLVGALSFVPGGVGTTELAIVLMLGRFGVPVPEAAAAAIGVRLVTLWFAIAVGAVSLLALEINSSREIDQRTV